MLADDRDIPPRTLSIARRVGWSLAGLLLLAPAVAMRWTGEVAWGSEDFVVFGAMLLVAGIALEIVARWRPRRRSLVAAAIVVATLFLLVWVELAVGWFGPG